MSYKIVADSCCDLTEDMKKWDSFEVVPLTLQINDYQIRDDSNFDQDDFIKRMNANGGLAKSACPSPESFKKAMEGNFDEVYVLTITDKLSGTYNSAVQGKMLYEDEHSDGKKIYIFNSLATSGLETLIAIELKKMCDSGASFEEITKEIDDYIVNRTGLYFCLESLNALKSNGRLFALAANILQKIRVKLVCERTSEGNISLSGQDLTTNRALIKMAGLIASKVEGKDLKGKTAVVSYVCSPERAEFTAEKIREKTGYENVITLKASGLNSLYASDGGIIVSYEF